MEYQNVFIVTNAIIGGAGMIGYSFSFTADFNKVRDLIYMNWFVRLNIIFIY